jgi:hypothetical protein
MQTELSPSTREELGPLIEVLARFGFAPSSVLEGGAFGDFRVGFSGADGEFIAITRDRSKFSIDAGRSVLEPAGLWQAFNSASLLAEPLAAWLQSRRA